MLSRPPFCFHLRAYRFVYLYRLLISTLRLHSLTALTQCILTPSGLRVISTTAYRFISFFN